MKRKICVFIGSRANYSSIKSVMAAIKNDNSLELQLVLGASAVLDRFGKVENLIREDRIYQIPSIIQSGSVDGMQSLDQDLQRLVSKGDIERKIAQSIADNPKLFAQNVL